MSEKEPVTESLTLLLNRRNIEVLDSDPAVSILRETSGSRENNSRSNSEEVTDEYRRLKTVGPYEEEGPVMVSILFQAKPVE